MCGTVAVSTGLSSLMRVEMFPLFSSISNFLNFLIVGLREEPLIRTLQSILNLKFQISDSKISNFKLNFLHFLIVGFWEEPLIRTLPSISNF